jgi:hypothetical protein
MTTRNRKITYLLSSGLMIVVTTLFSSSAYVSTIPAGRFINKVFNNVTTTTVQFGSNTNPLNNNATVNLSCDIYQPTGDTCSSRPCIVCIYGGGFTGGGRGGEAGDATTYAQYGYVAVCPDYRMWGSPGGDGSDAQHKIWPAGFVVTAQDARACIRYMRAHASTYKIDTTRIVIAGCSSGAFITLNTAFMDKPSKIPSVVDTNIYGGIEGKSGTPGVSSKVCAAAGNSGAMLDTNWIEPTSPPYAGYQSTPDGWGVPTDTGTPTSHWGPYFTYYGITPISARLTHLGLLASTLVGSPGAHCPGGFADSSHMFIYNAICEVGRKSGNNTNLALNKTATQSSTSANLAASRAVDGNTNGTSSGNSFCLTNSDAQAWWQVNLGGNYIIDSIWAYNRSDSLVNHQTNYDVKFGTDGTNWETCAYERGIMGTPSRYHFRSGIIGRYVRIQLRGTNSLSMAEVQVWARDTNNIVTGAIQDGNPSLSVMMTGAHSTSFLVTTDAGAFSVPQSLRGSASLVDIYDLSGKLVGRSMVNGGRVQMNVTRSAKTGIYLVRLVSVR